MHTCEALTFSSLPDGQHRRMAATRNTSPRSVVLDLDADAAYAFLTDLEFMPTWYPGLTKVSEAPADGDVRDGTRFTEHRRLAPGVNVAIELEVRDAEPGRRFEVANTNHRLGVIDAAYELEPLGGERTRVHVRHHVTPSTFLLAPATAVLTRLLARADRQQLRAMPGGVRRWQGQER
jgi:uncharacterized protein YndB with AHSA1/START domain